MADLEDNFSMGGVVRLYQVDGAGLSGPVCRTMPILAAKRPNSRRSLTRCHLRFWPDRIIDHDGLHNVHLALLPPLRDPVLAVPGPIL